MSTPADPDSLESSFLYAIIESGRLECPSCSRILVFGGTGQGRVDRRAWNPLTHRITCTGCGETYQLGVIVWPTERGGGVAQVSPDQKTSVRLAAEVRRRSGGFWVRRRKRAGDPANRWVAQPCTCAPLPWREGCPIHGVVWIAPAEGVTREELRQTKVRRGAKSA